MRVNIVDVLWSLSAGCFAAAGTFRIALRDYILGCAMLVITLLWFWARWVHLRLVALERQLRPNFEEVFARALQDGGLRRHLASRPQ